jgi:hypothetical protein
MAHATLRQLETTLPTRPVPEPSEQQRAAVVAQCAEFARDGYLYLPQVLAKTHVENWADRFASNGFFQSIFDDLYQRGQCLHTHALLGFSNKRLLQQQRPSQKNSRNP